MASQPVMEAAARESKANAREDMAVLTSGAREKVDGAMASAQAVGQTLLHPFDRKKREDAQAAAEEQKQAAREKRDEIRNIAAQQAHSERVAARSLVAKGVSEAGGARYPVVSSDPPQQCTGPHGVEADSDQPAHPPIVDKPLQNKSDTPTALHARARDRLEALHNQDVTSGGSDTHTNPPKPIDGISRESATGNRTTDVDTKGVEDADFYPSPRIVQT